jgi:ABC-type nitrate/sulfonate/bicarbonate transport system ATPase subunit
LLREPCSTLKPDPGNAGVGKRNMTSFIRLEAQTCAFYNHLFFEEFSFEIPLNSWAAITGASGSGKTTLLSHIASSNSGFFMLPTENRLIPWLSIEKNVAISDMLRSRPVDTHRVKSSLEQMHIDHAINMQPHELSSGMARRTLLARAMYTNSDLLLLDEPFSNIDKETKELIIRDLKISKRTVLFTTHNTEELEHADTIFKIDNNRLIKTYERNHE